MFLLRGLATALLAGALAPSGAAQVLTWDGAIINEQVDFSLQGDPGELYLLGVSAFPGPTPLAAISPGDPRSLSISLTSLGLWRSGTLDPAGNANEQYPLPLNPSQVGTAIYSQFVTLPGTTFLVDDLSNPASFRLAMHGSEVNTVGTRNPTDTHSVSLLGDGRLLLAGGMLRSTQGDAAVDSIELYDPVTQTFAASAATMQEPRARHSATVLPDGRVLLLGGVNDQIGNALRTGDLYDPLTDSAVAIADMSIERSAHTATLLADGRVLVVGGADYDNTIDLFGTAGGAHATSELYDPASDTWAPGPALPLPLFGHAATRLADGTVLVSGGVEVTTLFGFPQPQHTANCMRFDPTGEQWLAAGALPSARAFHAQLLPTGDTRPIAAGGNRFAFFVEYEFLAECVQYDPTLDTWAVVGALGGPRSHASLVDTGTELVLVGGFDDLDNTIPIPVPNPEQTIETAPLDGTVWTGVVEMLLPRQAAQAAVVDGGDRVVITGVGDDGATAVDTTAEVFVP